MSKVKDKILSVLKADARLWNEEMTELNQTKLLDLVESIDEVVINLLLSEEELREEFFVKIKDVYVFKTNGFRFFMEENKVDNSYTAYKNRIGLTDGKKFLKYSSDVVLDFPFKDCILEGGQSTEEGTDTYFEYSDKTEQYEPKEAKRKEVFFNQVLAKDEIDRLLDSKALVNWKKFTKDGEVQVDEISRDGIGVIRENLIIKGNNLLALHTLKSQFTGRVKLIYIDPPFNTGKDEFKYNDNFNHSTWLTFLKNRLEVARDLLSDDGIIFVHVGNEESSYVQILLDEVFGRDSYLNHITMTTNAASGFKATSAKIFSTSNHIFIYAKNPEKVSLKKLYVSKDYDESYKYVLLNPSEPFSSWKYKKIIDALAEEHGFSSVKAFKGNFSKEIIRDQVKEFAHKNREQVFRTAAVGGGALKKRKLTIEKSKREKGIVFQHPDEDVKDFYILNGEQIVFWSNSYKEVDGDSVPATSLTDVWTDIGFTGIANEGGVTLKNGKKPETLLKRVLELGSEKGDIILDFFAGSGTTPAVAHKLGRQWIAIEQLDYRDDNPEMRMKNVVSGDVSGVSKMVNWRGGGSFLYCELAKWNETAKEQILEAKTLEELEVFFDEMYEKFFLNYNLKTKEFKEKVIKEEQFRNLSLDEQKQIFVEMLDNNQMYVNKTEMADKKFGIAEADQRLTDAFYNETK